MNKLIFQILAGAVLFCGSCARVETPDDPVALRIEWRSPGASKVDVLAANDAVGLFARVDGQATMALANHRFVSDAAGVLSGAPTAYYPDPLQAVGLYAYHPFRADQTDPGRVAYATPVDQTTDPAFRLADLLWGATQTTPSSAVVPITFSHLLARVVLSVVDGAGVVQTVDRWGVHDAIIDGTLAVETGLWTLGTTRALIGATGRNELIVPAQSVAVLACTVGGVDYSFQPAAPVVLEAGKSHALRLTLNAANHTATLAEPITVTEWSVAQGAGAIDGVANNRFTVYWALPSVGYQGATRSVVHLTSREGVVQDVETTYFSALSVDQPYMCTYQFDLVDAEVSYPYTINGVSFFDASDHLIQLCSSLLGATVYRSGPYTLGIQAGNVLSVVEGRVNSFTEVFGSGAISGGVANQFVLQLLEPQATGYDYTQIKQVRLTADGVVYSFLNTTFTGNSNVLVAITQSFAFTSARPAGYPYTVERVELLDAAGAPVGAPVGGTAGVFDADVMVSRGGVVTMQLFRGKATSLIGGSSFVAYGSAGATDAPMFTGTVTDSPIELVYTLGNGVPAAGKGATSVARAEVTVKTADGASHAVSLAPYAMVGTPLSARSSGVINIVSGAGWPAGASYPYQITHIALYDGAGNELVARTAFSTPFEVRWSTKATLSVMKYN